MDQSEDTENGSSSGSEEEDTVVERKSQQTESEADSEEEDVESVPAPPQAVKRKAVAQGAPKVKRIKGGLKGATTAYIYYWQEAQATLKAEHPELQHKDLARICGQNWKALSASEKQPYVERATADRLRYDAEREAGAVVEPKHTGDGRPSKKAAFVLFCKEHRGPLKLDDPGHTPQEYRKILGDRWKALSAEEKKAFAGRANGSPVALAGAGVVGQIDELLAGLRKRVEARMLRADIGFHEMKGLLEIVCKSSNYELLRRLDAYPSIPPDY